MERLALGDVDVLLLDLGLPDSQGLETAVEAMRSAPAVPIVVLTGYDDDEAAAEAIERGAQDYLVKGGFSGAALRRAIRYAIESQAGGDRPAGARGGAARIRGALPRALRGSRRGHRPWPTWRPSSTSTSTRPTAACSATRRRR